MLLTTSILLVGCGNKITCDLCDQEGKGKVTNFMGTEIAICDECLGNMEDVFGE